MTRLDEIKKKMLELEEETPNWKDTTVYVAGFMDGAMWADQHPHWISVEDELPPKQPNREQSKNVLVRTNSGRTKIEYYDYGNDVIKEWWEHNITHWMPLPQPPKEGGWTMIRPHIDITMHQGYLGKVYPPLQWNEQTSQRKMLTDVREWLHNHHPSWKRAMVYLSHYRGIKTHTDAVLMERGCAL